MKIQCHIIILSLLFMLCGNSSGYAQKQGQAAIDSLLKELPNTKEDTNKVMLLDDLSFAYRNTDPDEGIKYGQKELELATSLDWKKGIGWANNDLGVNYAAKADYPKAVDFYFKSLQINQASGNKNGIADNLGNIGVAYAGQKDYTHALEFYFKALRSFEELGDKNGTANALGNAGIIYIYQSNYPMALEDLSKAVKIYRQLGNTGAMAAAYSNIGLVYVNQNNYSKALEYYFQALENNQQSANRPAIADNLASISTAYKSESDFANALEYENKALRANEELGDKTGIIKTVSDIGNIYLAKGDYPAAFENMFKAFKMAEALDNKYLAALNLGNIGVVYREQRNYTPALLCHFKAAKIDSEIADKFDESNNLGNIGMTYLSMAKDTGKPNKTLPDSALHTGPYLPGTIPWGKRALLGKAVEYLNKAIAIKKETGDMENLQAMFQRLSQADTLLGDYKGALAAYKQYAAFKDSVFSGANKILIANFETERNIEVKHKQAEIDALAKAKEHNEQLLKLADVVVVVLFSLLVVSAVVIIYSRKKTKQHLSQEKEISVESHNVPAPEAMVEEIVEMPATEALRFDNVTALVTDFVNFTNATERMAPQQLVDELHLCFLAFDEIIAKYNMEKIKTMGDAYLALAGIPVADPLHAEYTVMAAVEINTFMQGRKRQMGDKTFEVRIGIHSGSVIAGTVGVKKSAYDAWGESVSTAMCMEQNSEAGRITISQATYGLVKDKINCTYRGKIAVKNNETMNMYFVALPEPE